MSRYADFCVLLAGHCAGDAGHDLLRADFGLIGLAVMGQNLIMNIADHGFKVLAYNRTVEKVRHFLANEAKGRSSLAFVREKNTF